MPDIKHNISEENSVKYASIIYAIIIILVISLFLISFDILDFRENKIIVVSVVGVSTILLLGGFIYLRMNLENLYNL